jgi:hypothetical protein
MTNAAVHPRVQFSGGHVSAGTTVDVGREVLTPMADKRLQEHLASCARCRARVATWTRFASLALDEERMAPPRDAVSRVLALAAPAGRVSPVTRIAAILNYHTPWAPAPAGARGPSLPEQTAYEAEGVAVDVRVTRESPRKLVIVGQLAHARQPQRRLADLPVMLVDGDEVKVRALSNAWGEFHLEHHGRARVRLEIGLPGGRVIRIPLRSNRRSS